MTKVVGCGKKQHLGIITHSCTERVTQEIPVSEKTVYKHLSLTACQNKAECICRGFSDLGREIKDKSSEGLCSQLLKYLNVLRFLSLNSVIPVAEKHLGALFLTLFSITTILICRNVSLMSKFLSSLVWPSYGLLMLWFTAKHYVQAAQESSLIVTSACH